MPWHVETDTVQKDRRHDAHICDPERNLYLVAAADGVSGAFSTSNLMWAFEEQSHALSDTLERFHRNPAAGLRQEVLLALKRLLLSAGEGSSISCLLIGGGAAFIANTGGCPVFLLREGRAHKVTGKSQGGTQLGSLELFPKDRLILATRGLGAGTNLSAVGSADDVSAAAKALTQAAREADASGDITVMVVEPETTPEAYKARQRAKAINDLFLFKGLPFEVRLQANRILGRAEFGPNEKIVTEGENGDSMYVIVQGQCRVTLKGKELTVLEAGQNFGELTLADDTPRSATVTSVGRTEVVVIERRQLEAVYEDTPELGIVLLRKLLVFLAERVRDLSHKLAG